MFVAIRYYQTAPDSIDEVVRRVKEGFVPIIRDTQGFVSYFVLAPSEREDELVSVSVFEDQRSAEVSNEKAEDWVKQNLSEILLLPEFAAGEVVVYEAHRDIVGPVLRQPRHQRLDVGGVVRGGGAHAP